MLPRELETAIYGSITTTVLKLTDKHGILECLTSGGAMTSTAVADRLELDRDTVERLLLVLNTFDLVRRDTDGAYTLHQHLAPYFDRRDPSYVGGFVDHMLEATAIGPELLDRYLVEGKAAVDASRPAPYETFYRDEESVREFMDAMWSLSYAVSQELVPLAGIDHAKMLVDVGGASGPFSIAALQQVPGLRAVVFDLPEVEPHVHRSRETYGVRDRLDFTPGDFFRDELPRGDVIAFGYVMSNWPDEQCARLLAKAYQSCEPGGRVLLMERLFDDDRSGPVATSVMNLMMHFETNGRHRVPAEYFALLEGAGFTDCTVQRSTRDKHLLIGRKP
jgi:hypothetical protein